MPWYDVYDNVEVQLLTRKQAAGTTGIVSLVLVVTTLALAFGLEGSMPLALAICGAVVVWAWFGWWFIHRIRHLRRVIWCIKLSRSEVVGYDYARRRITISWRAVERIDLDDQSLTIVGRPPLCLEVTHLFSDFPQVSHRIVHYADRYNIPIFVNGKPWQQIDVYDVFPFLSGDASPPRHGSTAV